MLTRLIGVSLLAVLAGCSSKAEGVAAREKPANALNCDGVAPVAKAKVAGNPDARKAAQRGLGYLTKASRDWTARNHCFGCHVQAVTMEALTVGMHHQYDVGMKDVDDMAQALMMGVTAGGHTTGIAFQGQAWSRYDNWINPSHKGELLDYAAQLIAVQQADGSIPDDDARLPITGGTMQTTYQAMQTWRQAFARTADDKWLAPMRKAEQFLARQSIDWTAKSEVYLQNINFALLGLVAAGTGNGEASSLRLQKLLLARQNQDGGWGLDAGKSDALATGQTLYALRLSGHGDGEGAIDRGTRWLVGHQAQDGAWRTYHSNQGGAEKGEGMWAVLGLVSMDVTSVAVNGITDGQHVTPKMALAIEARDNSAGGVKKVELFLDDQRLTGACASTLAYEWTTQSLVEGKHTVDIVATNSQNQTSRRRYEVYAGNVYLTELGTRFDDRSQATEIAVRNIALEPTGTVELAIYTTDDKTSRGKKVFDTTQAASLGALTFTWTGAGSDGAMQTRGKYLAELTYRDKAGKALHKSETYFVHDSEAAQRANFAEVEGQLSMEAASGVGLSANTTVELVDGTGNVVQRATSTAQGNYRFKAVPKGAYKIRTSKAGFKSQEAWIDAKPAAPATKADLHLK
ncbi:MAG TPA: carboxypeptidase regulatory-like domain-containing protein [Kofleriaceae bacterium]